MLYYAGIGSRTTPVQSDILTVAAILAEDGWILRSGGAEGADSFFEQGCDMANGEKEIFLPWKGFNGNSSKLFDPPPAANEITDQFHPAAKILSPTARKLMNRNAQQVLGQNLNSPSQFVICWTQDGAENNKEMTIRSGTHQAIRIANFYNIPVINMNKNNWKKRLQRTLDILNILD